MFRRWQLVSIAGHMEEDSVPVVWCLQIVSCMDVDEARHFGEGVAQDRTLGGLRTGLQRRAVSNVQGHEQLSRLHSTHPRLYRIARDAAGNRLGYLICPIFLAESCAFDTVRHTELALSRLHRGTSLANL
jgi:hypothetical protein